jgi:DnaK suppressor protein
VRVQDGQMSAGKKMSVQLHSASPVVDTSEDNSEVLEFFRTKLLEERTDIMNRSSSAVVSGEMQVSRLGDECDLASAEATVAESARFMERKAHLLNKIERALKRIDEGTYLICESCDDDLSIPRLKARPVASLCIACKEEQESLEKAFA